MRLITNGGEYLKVMKPVSSLDLPDMGLFPDLWGGIFKREHLSKLIEFCSSNPKYHIATEVQACHETTSMEKFMTKKCGQESFWGGLLAF